MAYAPVYTITINAPTKKVFDYVADVSRHGEWGMDNMKAEAEKPGPATIGSRYRAEGTLLGKPNGSVVTITDLEPPRRLGIDAEDATSIFHHEFVLTAIGDSTNLERRVTIKKGPWFNPIMLTLFGGTVAKNYNGALAKLKAKLEA